jgi:hypothetical protein
MRVARRDALALLAFLGALTAATAPTLGADPERFRVGTVHGSGLLGPIVRAADGHWDRGVIGAPAYLAALLLVVAAVAGARAASWRRDALVTLAAVVVVLLVVPATLLAVGLRRCSAPNLYTNDSTYQIEIAGDLVLHGHNPYGHDYRDTGLPRWYETVRQPTDNGEAALHHFAYFPGTAIAAAAWRVLPHPLDDYRLLVLLATLALLPAALALPGPFAVRLAGGVALAANPVAAHAPWFGTADAPSLLLLVLAFVFAARGRAGSAGAALAGAVLLKQFALVALPFFAIALLARGRLRRAATAFAAVAAAGFLPFVIAGPLALWHDTITYGTGTYRIVGYGLAGLLVEAGVVARRGSYPFAVLALLVWLPVTAWLVATQRARTPRSLAAAAAGIAVSVFVLLWIGRVFQTSYFMWPLTALVVAGVLAAAGRREDAGTLAG